jgi:hypothetical protein
VRRSNAGSTVQAQRLTCAPLVHRLEYHQRQARKYETELLDLRVALTESRSQAEMQFRAIDPWVSRFDPWNGISSFFDADSAHALKPFCRSGGIDSMAQEKSSGHQIGSPPALPNLCTGRHYRKHGTRGDSLGQFFTSPFRSVGSIQLLLSGGKSMVIPCRHSLRSLGR